MMITVITFLIVSKIVDTVSCIVVKMFVNVFEILVQMSEKNVLTAFQTSSQDVPNHPKNVLATPLIASSAVSIVD